MYSTWRQSLSLDMMMFSGRQRTPWALFQHLQQRRSNSKSRSRTTDCYSTQSGTTLPALPSLFSSSLPPSSFRILAPSPLTGRNSKKHLASSCKDGWCSITYVYHVAYSELVCDEGSKNGQKKRFKDCIAIVVNNIDICNN